MAELMTSNQIGKIQTAKKCLSLMDKLKPVDPRHYAQLHAKGESVSGVKQSSLIQAVLQDYSNGTGANNIRVTFNLAPEQVQFFLSRIEAGFLEFEWSNSKIYGDPDPNGYSIAQYFSIKRAVKNQNGEDQRSPWNIYIANGKGIKIKNNFTGGYAMQSGSFIRESQAYIQCTDMDLYTLFKRADSYIKNWEAIYAKQIIPEGMKLYEEFSQKQKQYGQEAYGQAAYGQNPYGEPPQQYGHGAYEAAPQYGQAAYGNAPQYAQPSYEQPAYEQQVYVQPGYAQPNTAPPQSDPALQPASVDASQLPFGN